METRDIRVRGARVHNLKNVDLELPANRLICFTGVSGSGKSSMAFDTLYAEGQRRYVASLSAYARQFLGQMEKPDVDQITGLPPAISISQKTGGQNPRSTVGTITEIYDYLRVLFARCGTPHCVECGREIGAQTRDQIAARIASLEQGSRVHVLAPLVRERRGEYHELFEELQKDGYVRVRVDGRVYTLDEAPVLDRYSRHNIEVVIDRLVIRGDIGGRLDEAVDAALRLGEGSLIVSSEEGEDRLLSASFDCPECGISYEEPEPQMFSFNNPQGMCRDCGGLGTKVIMSETLMIPDPSRSIAGGAVEPLGDSRQQPLAPAPLRRGRRPPRFRPRHPLEEAVADAEGRLPQRPRRREDRVHLHQPERPLLVPRRPLRGGAGVRRGALPQRQPPGAPGAGRLCAHRNLPHLRRRPPAA